MYHGREGTIDRRGAVQWLGWARAMGATVSWTDVVPAEAGWHHTMTGHPSRTWHHAMTGLGWAWAVGAMTPYPDRPLQGARGAHIAGTFPTCIPAVPVGQVCCTKTELMHPPVGGWQTLAWVAGPRPVGPLFVEGLFLSLPSYPDLDPGPGMALCCHSDSNGVPGQPVGQVVLGINRERAELLQIQQRSMAAARDDVPRSPLPSAMFLLAMASSRASPWVVWHLATLPWGAMAPGLAVVP